MDSDELFLWLVLVLICLAAVPPLLRRARRAELKAKWAPLPTVTELWAVDRRRSMRRRALESRVD